VLALVSHERRLLPTPAERDRLDRLAERALAALAPLTFALARTPLEIDAVLRMRYETVIGLGWARPEDYPDGRERDEYDDGATLVVCRDGGAIVGSARVVPPVLGGLLPAEREFHVRVPPPGRPVEVGRIVVPPSSRAGRSHLIMAGLFARTWLVARDLGYDRIVSTASAPLVELYRGLGLTVIELARPRLSWGEERALIELAGSEQGLEGLARAAGLGQAGDPADAPGGNAPPG
jgi:N-acyl-L-homoserine lactone synthetase